MNKIEQVRAIAYKLPLDDSRAVLWLCDEVQDLHARIEDVESERDQWQSTVAKFTNLIPTRDILGATGTIGDLLTYFRKSMNELSELRATIAAEKKGN